MRTAEVVRRAAGYLDRHGVDSPQATAETLMSSLLQVDRVAIYSSSHGLTPTQAREFGRALCLRCSGVPAQHITGVQGFRRLTLRVRPGVFVPRPETEIVVGVALEAMKDVRAPLIADVGTGTGAIAISIADEHPGSVAYATDVSEDAMSLARDNAGAAGVDLRIFHGSLLEPLPTDLKGRLNLVVSNPPYVAPRTAVPPEVSADPPTAVFGEPAIYEELADQARGWLKPGGALVVEIEETSSKRIVELFRHSGFVDVNVTRDLNGRDRVVSGHAPTA